MATDLENLTTRRSAILAELASLDTTKAGGLPNASGEGVRVDHVGYRLSLYQELEAIEKRIAAAQGPVIVETLGEV